jgi:hypothetical protein
MIDTISSSPTSPGNLFGQAMDAFQSAIQTGVKMQEESTRRYLELLGQFGSPADWQKTTQKITNEAITATQQSIDQSIQLINQNAQRAVVLLEKAFETRPTQAGANGNDTAESLWGTALKAMRSNTQTILDANARMLESWSHLTQEFAGNAQAAAG